MHEYMYPYIPMYIDCGRGHWPTLRGRLTLLYMIVHWGYLATHEIVVHQDMDTQRTPQYWHTATHDTALHYGHLATHYMTLWALRHT